MIYESAADLYAGLEDESVQLIWTDPPFGTGARQEGSKHSYQDGTTADTLEIVRELAEESKRVLTPTGVLALCLDYRAVHEAYAVLRDAGLHYQREIIWHFELGAISRKWWTNKHNTILLFSRNKEAAFDHDAVPTTLRKAPRGEHQSAERKVNSVWNYTMGPCDRERVGRANQKPLAVVEPFVLVHTKPGDLVVDPYAGTGTTGVAALSAGRRFAGADVVPAAREIMFERMKEWNTRP